ncbi:50S ribosomal protein L29 [Sphaerobacter thermophilus]|jgi:large subunit ribosomal protein L29|uniref:Large ribosomal subunit protein uL29 n=1 Tax=Sphaerobacter thermophilus (strain ATCC 49802 / DSM 20745 / KCCM 41009 / NCIMB 13125 / S 6022) TaxID=479434 RepID=D1C2L3_SPHTD|nr:50S ribosomal protein L29 [Sphaerobacter thermophilus]ACZ38480.1 ribosomal protein L29 [Sphaerobacter thermophilus DSM 20745]PZN68016.1 MAG: 50S ribosomal protein L29 [Sphaerobacter thermophilus]
MKPDEIRAMSDAELMQKLDELRSEWRDLRFDEAIGKLTNTARIRQIKRDIARIKTIQTERRIAAEMEKARAQS